jgi:uracil-DNA glycosylase family 4
MYSLRMLQQLQPESPYPPDVPQVFPKEPLENVKLLCLGEAPGRDEVRLGEFFIGKSGQLLREILKDENVLEETYFTNVSWWRPPRTANSEGDERPGIQVVRAQQARLFLEITMVRPQAIVALGKSASEGIVNAPFHRGVVEVIRVAGNTIPVFQTWHPAYCLRFPQFYSDICQDIGRAVRLEIPRAADISYTIPSDPPQFVGRSLVLDIESTSVSASADIVCVAVRDQETTYLFTKEMLPTLWIALGKFRGKLVAHNSQYDEAVLRRHGIPVTIEYDSLLLHLSLDNRRGTHSLKTLAPVYGNRSTAEILIAPYIDTTKEDVWENTPRELLYAYNAADAVATYDLFSGLAKMASFSERRLFFFLQRASRALAEGKQKGILVDRKVLHEAREEQERRVREAHDSFSFDPDSPQQTVKALNATGFDVYSSAEEVLTKLSGDLPAQLLKYREESKIVKAFLLPLDTEWIGEDGAVHPTVMLWGTDTGRTSCESPNLQQTPKELRHLFVPRPGYTFIGYDLRANEVRCIAYYSRDAKLCQMLRDGLDPHQAVADAVGVDRQIGKTFVFASLYGAGVSRLRASTGLGQKEIYRALDIVKEMFPGLQAWKEKVIEDVKRDGFVQTPFGRRISFPYQEDAWRIERQAVNALPQSLGSDIALVSAIRLWECLGLPPLTFVHDSCLVECEESKLKKTLPRLKEILTDLFPNPYVDFLVDLRVGSNWRDLNAI